MYVFPQTNRVSTHGLVFIASSCFGLEVRAHYPASRSRVLTLSTAFIPLWILPSTFSALSAGAFFVQFGVQGAWGVVRMPFSLFHSRIHSEQMSHQIPIQLAEMSPPAFRATFPGVAYQIGNVGSTSLSATFRSRWTSLTDDILCVGPN